MATTGWARQLHLNHGGFMLLRYVSNTARSLVFYAVTLSQMVVAAHAALFAYIALCLDHPAVRSHTGYRVGGWMKKMDGFFSLTRILAFVLVFFSATNSFAVLVDPMPGPAALVSLDEATKAMYPMYLDAEINRVVREDKSELVQYVLALDGIPVLNLGLRASYTVRGAIQVLDQVIAPKQIPAPQPKFSVYDAERIMQKRYPFYYARDFKLAYFAERDPKNKDDSKQVLSGMRLVWSFGLFPTNKVDNFLDRERQMLIDALSGEIVGDQSATVSVSGLTPAPFVGHGYYANPVIMTGSASGNALGEYCLRDPQYDTAPFLPCEDMLSNRGFATYLYQNPDVTVTGRTPIANIGFSPEMGNGLVPTNATDLVGLQSVGVDAHYFVSKSIQFYRQFFNRDLIGSTDGTTLGVIAYDPRPSSIDNAFADGLSSEIRVGPRSNSAFRPMGDAQALMHEYTHLLMEYQYRSMQSGGAHLEHRSLDEGIADIFGILLTPSMAPSPAGTLSGIRAPSARWIFGENVFADPHDIHNRRFFDNPSDDGVSVNAYGEASNGVSFAALDPHDQSGVIRRWFYYLANGYAETTALNNHISSRYYPRGMVGIGVEAATRVLYRTITETSDPGNPLTYFRFRQNMMNMLAERPTGCDATYKAVENAWAGVNMGSGADYAAPTITGELEQMGDYVRIRAYVRDQGHGLGLPSQQNLRVFIDNIGIATLPLTFSSSTDDLVHYAGAVSIHKGFFIGSGSHTVALGATDWCQNSRTTTIGSIQIDSLAPIFHELTDVTSKSWSGRPEPLANPMVLSTKVRQFYARMSDPSGLKILSLVVGPRTEYYAISGKFAARAFNFDFTSSLSPTDGTYSVLGTATDIFNNPATKIIDPYNVDRTPPERCEISSCRQISNEQHFSCRVDARDEGSGIFATEMKTIDPSPVSGPVPNQLTSQMYDGWYWGLQYSDRLPGAPFWTGGESSKPNVVGQTVSPLPLGQYTVALRCRDFWNNTTAPVTTTVKVSSVPVITIGPVRTTTSGSYTVTATATDSDGLDYMVMQSSVNGDFQFDRTLVDCNPNNSVVTSCAITKSGSPGPGRTVIVQFGATDQDLVNSRQHVEFTLPMPPPPPPPPPSSPTTMNESENNDRYQDANLVGTNILLVNGTYVVGDNDNSGCKVTWNQLINSCNILQPWTCQSRCGDHFRTTLAAGATFFYRFEKTANPLCAVDGPMTRGSNGPGPTIEVDRDYLLGNEYWVKVRNSSASSATVYVAIWPKDNNNTGNLWCATGTTVPYRLHIQR